MVSVQAAVLGERLRSFEAGYRRSNVFIGGREPNTMLPRPDAVCARSVDVRPLMEALCEADSLALTGLHPIAHAAAAGYGFVFVHPFEDGNGRTHRWLLQRIIARLRLGLGTPWVPPISVAFHERQDEYIACLQTHGRPALACTDWETDGRNNVRILNDTRDLYAYWDATPQAEHLSASLRRAIGELVPAAARKLRAGSEIDAEIDAALPGIPGKDRVKLVNYLANGNGTLGRKRRKELGHLEAAGMERVARAFRRIHRLPEPTESAAAKLP
jgi:hypothetical protein